MSEATVAREALRLAIQMEKEGKKFYLEASKKSGNEAGQKLFRSLAREEDTHRRDFEKIYGSLRDKYEWPSTETATKKPRRRAITAGTAPQGTGAQRPADDEVTAVKTAIRMENDSYDFYRKQLARAAYPGEKAFYEALSAAESAHRLILVDYLEFLTDPAGYFVKKERPTLD